MVLPAHLPREEEVLEPEDKQDNAEKLGEAITEILEYTPGKVYVKRYVRPKYVQPTQDEDTKQVLIAPLPTMPIPNGNVGAGLLAHLLISKYVDHLPFYRQVQIFKREGLKLAESTISGWFKAACKLLDPLYYELRKEVLSSGYLMADETPIPVQSSNKPGATHTGYMWVYRSPEKGMVIFDYQQSRGAQGPEGVLEGFSGALQTDGYAAYDRFDKASGVTLLACMAHVRRKFDQAKENDSRRSEYALAQIQKLYALERQCKEENLNTDQVKAARQQYAVPVLTAMKEWMEQQCPNVAPKSSIGKALTYALKLWPRIVRYTENGSWNIDNNLVENSIRPVALGRKNYLFAGSHDAAQWAAVLYSFLATCKAN
ncbi:IS66 family transposase, partial [Marinoscillum furvescens]